MDMYGVDINNSLSSHLRSSGDQYFHGPRIYSFSKKQQKILKTYSYCLNKSIVLQYIAPYEYYYYYIFLYLIISITCK